MTDKVRSCNPGSEVYVLKNKILASGNSTSLLRDQHCVLSASTLSHACIRSPANLLTFNMLIQLYSPIGGDSMRKSMADLFKIVSNRKELARI